MRIFNHVDSFTIFKGRLSTAGWAFCAAGTIVDAYLKHSASDQIINLQYGQSSPDVAQHYGERAGMCRFAYSGAYSFPIEATNEVVLCLKLTNGELVEVKDFIRESLIAEPVHRVFHGFSSHINGLAEGTVIELGARARSGNIRRSLIAPQLKYIGVDVLDGPNVDLVADAHLLSEFLPAGCADGVFSFSVFEHLIMPWKVALELNKIMKTGALGFVITHQSWPVHDAPCDYWRFSDQAWKGLFNIHSGFEILDSKMSDPAFIVPQTASSDRLICDMPNGFLQSAVLFRKIAETKLRWDVDAASLVQHAYPE
jgi:hypothetical protein